MLSKKLFLASILLFVLASYLLIGSVDASSEMWSRTYGGPDLDIAYSLVETSDGGYALAGASGDHDSPYGSADIWLIKTDMYGNVEWNQTYGGEGHEEAYSLVETSDGGYALAGTTDSFGAGGIDVWLVKTDAYGNIVWNRTYGEAQYEYARSLVETADGGYALAGYSGAPDIAYGSADVWLVKTDAYGNIEWNQTYGKGTVYSLVETVDGGYALAGFSDSVGGPRNVLLLKTDANGNMVWNHTYGGANDGEANSLVETSDGGYAIAVTTRSFGAGGADFWLIKTDAYGNVEWNHTYGGADFDLCYCLIVTSDGGYAIAGYTRSYGAGARDFWLVKTDAQGIPEFPSWTILPLLLVATLVVIIYKQKLPKKPYN